MENLVKLNYQEMNYINRIIPAFAARGAVSRLLNFVPQPGEPGELPKETYQQIIDTMLLNDYCLLQEQLKKWKVYDPKDMIQKIK